MPSLNLDLDYFDDIRTKRLVGLLGKGAEVLPIQLWRSCGKHRVESGMLVGYSSQEIESMSGWWGANGQMVKAMLHVGFLKTILDTAGGGYLVVDWEEVGGHLAPCRERARKAARARWDRIQGSPPDHQQGKLLQASLEHASSNALAVQGSAGQGPAERTGSQREPVTDRCGNVGTVENNGPKPVPEKSQEQQSHESSIYREALFRIHDSGVLGNLGFFELAALVVREAAGDLFTKRGYRELAGARLEPMRETAWTLLRPDMDRISKMKFEARRRYLIARAVEVAALAGKIEAGKGKHGKEEAAR